MGWYSGRSVSSSVTFDCYALFRVGGTNYDSANTRTIPVSSGSYTDGNDLRTTNPNTSSDWQVAELASLEIGIHRAAGGATNGNITAVYAEYLAPLGRVPGNRAFIIMSKIQDFYDELKRGILPPHTIKREYQAAPHNLGD